MSMSKSDDEVLGTGEAGKRLAEVFKRAAVFQKTLTMAEIREVRKTYDSKEEMSDVLCGMYWIAKKRQEKNFPFPAVLAMTEDELLDAILEVLPEVEQ